MIMKCTFWLFFVREAFTAPYHFKAYFYSITTVLLGMEVVSGCFHYG
jgi:hypothetical protein